MRRPLVASVTALLVAGGLALSAMPAAADPLCTPALPDPTATLLEAAPGTTVVFPVPGLCLAPGGTMTTSYNPQGATVTWVADGSGSAGFTVDPANSDPAVVPVIVLADQGDGTTRSYSFAAYLGVSPVVVFPPAVPTQVAIERGGDGSFTIPGLYWPQYSECEVRVDTAPEIDRFVTEPPNKLGLPILVSMTREPDFVGKVILTYALACTPPGGERSQHTYTIELYVGIPIPTTALAATGSDAPGLAPMAWSAVAAGMLGAGALVASRRRRASR